MHCGLTQTEALRVFASHGEDVAGLDPEALQGAYRRVVRRYRAELQSGRGEALKAINPAFEVLKRTGTTQNFEDARKIGFSMPGDAEAQRARYQEELARRERERREYAQRERAARESVRADVEQARQESERTFKRVQTFASVAAFLIVCGLLLAGLRDLMNDNNAVGASILAVSSLTAVALHRLFGTIRRNRVS